MTKKAQLSRHAIETCRACFGWRAASADRSLRARRKFPPLRASDYWPSRYPLADILERCRVRLQLGGHWSEKCIQPVTD